MFYDIKKEHRKEEQKKEEKQKKELKFTGKLLQKFFPFFEKFNVF